MQMELERLRLEREADCAAGEGEEANQEVVRVLFLVGQGPLTSSLC